MLRSCASICLLSGVRFTGSWISFQWVLEHEGSRGLSWGKHPAAGAQELSWVLLRLDIGSYQEKHPLNRACFTNSISRELKVIPQASSFPHSQSIRLPCFCFE